MLLSFSVENYKSIRDEVTLSLSPSSAVKDQENNLISTGNEDFPTLLPTIAIYGTNGSGKSTLLRAIGFARNFILSSAKESTHGDKILVEPFLLDTISVTRPTAFALDFLIQGVRYVYRFSATQERIIHESLWAYPKGSKQAWFERTWKPNAGKYEWVFSSHYHGNKFVISEKTLDNTLYFSKAVIDNDEQFKPINDFFRDRLAVSYSGHDAALTYEFFQSEHGRKLVTEFLKGADLGLSEITVERIEVPSDLPNGGPRYIYNNRTVHKIPGTSQTVSFQLERSESTGTVKLFRMAGLIIKTLSTGGTLFIDELEQGLHHRLQCYLIDYFKDPKYNPRGAQLIFSTHAPLLLRKDLFRRDQVWFTSKGDVTKNTTLYSLIDVPKNVKNGKPVRKGQDLVAGFLDAKFYEPPKQEPIQFDLFEEPN